VERMERNGEEKEAIDGSRKWLAKSGGKPLEERGWKSPPKGLAGNNILERFAPFRCQRNGEPPGLVWFCSVWFGLIIFQLRVSDSVQALSIGQRKEKKRKET